MVFHYTNFVFETNAWWLRRIRPLWMGALGAAIFVQYYRYYFFGKIQALKAAYTSEEEFKTRAQLNKRNYGYNSIYEPTIERSKRKQLMEALGSNYKFADPYHERYMIDTRSLEQIMEEEENYQH